MSSIRAIKGIVVGCVFAKEIDELIYFLFLVVLGELTNKVFLVGYPCSSYGEM